MAEQKDRRTHARGRFISRSISTNEQLAGVSLLADFLFRACIPHLDCEGRMTGNVALIKAIAVPMRSELTPELLPQLIGELSAAIDVHGRPLVEWYDVRGTKVLAFPGFDDQQKGLRKEREAPSKLPPRNEMAVLLAPIPNHSGPTPELVRSSSGPTPPEVEVEGEGEVSPLPAREVQELQRWIAEQLPTDIDRAKLGEFARACPQPLKWLSEVKASLEGMGGHVPVTPVQMGSVIRDWVLNEPPWSAVIWRSYLERAKAGTPQLTTPRPRRAAAGGERPTPQQFEYTGSTEKARWQD